VAWLGIGLTLGWNYAQHRRHKPTICSVSRALPRPTLLALYGVGAVGLGVHVWRGYR